MHFLQKGQTQQTSHSFTWLTSSLYRRTSSCRLSACDSSPTQKPCLLSTPSPSLSRDCRTMWRAHACSSGRGEIKLICCNNLCWWGASSVLVDLDRPSRVCVCFLVTCQYRETRCWIRSPCLFWKSVCNCVMMQQVQKFGDHVSAHTFTTTILGMLIFLQQGFIISNLTNTLHHRLLQRNFVGPPWLGGITFSAGSRQNEPVTTHHHQHSKGAKRQLPRIHDCNDTNSSGRTGSCEQRSSRAGSGSVGWIWRTVCEGSVALLVQQGQQQHCGKRYFNGWNGPPQRSKHGWWAGTLVFQCCRVIMRIVFLRRVYLLVYFSTFSIETTFILCVTSEDKNDFRSNFGDYWLVFETLTQTQSCICLVFY